MKVTLLGTGTSSGVPRIGNDWGACDATDPRNRRRRVSIMVEHGDVRLVVDTGPDFRAQMLDAGVAKLTGVLYTHDHADHTHGIDDLRQVFHALGRPVDAWAHPATWRSLRQRFAYVFEGRDGYPPTVTAHEMPDALALGGLTVRWFPQIHGDIRTAGFRFEAAGKVLVYSTDLNALPDEAHPFLEGVDLWIVDALRRKPHPSHAHLALTLEWIARFRPGRALLTHLDQSMDHATLLAELPAGVEPGHDNQVVELAA